MVRYGQGSRGNDRERMHHAAGNRRAKQWWRSKSAGPRFKFGFACCLEESERRKQIEEYSFEDVFDGIDLTFNCLVTHLPADFAFTYDYHPLQTLLWPSLMANLDSPASRRNLVHSTSLELATTTCAFPPWATSGAICELGGVTLWCMEGAVDKY